MDSGTQLADSQARLKQFLEEENESLMRTLRVYVARAHLAEGELDIRRTASDLLSEVAVEALVWLILVPGPYLVGLALLGLIGRALVKRYW